MICAHCGAEVASVALPCTLCGQSGRAPGPPPLPPRPVSTGEFFFPRNGPALASYYLGIFSFIPVIGFVTGILAILFGVNGLKRERAHPEARGGAHAWVGLICGSVFVLGHLAVAFALLAAKER